MEKGLHSFGETAAFMPMRTRLPVPTVVSWSIRFVCNVRYQALHGFKRTRISYKLVKRKEKA